MKVWLLTNTPSPYQLEFLEHLHRSGTFDLTVRFLRGVHRGEQPLDGRATNFPLQVLRGAGPRRWRDEFRYHPQALREVLRAEHDVYVLSGHYTSPTFLACASVLRACGRPWAVWLERPWPTGYRPRWATRASVRIPGAAAFRQRVLGSLVRSAPAVLSIGSAARDAYRELGAENERLFLLPYICNVERFGAPEDASVSRLRRELRMGDDVVFLYSGLLEERKGVDVLIQAFARVAAEQPRVRLLVLGDGPLRPALEKQVPEPLRGQIHFLGFKSQPELPDIFGLADVFVFPSRHDGWGVVVNEALGAGLPIVATRQTGAAIDLVVDGENGFLVDRDDVETMAARMLHLAQDRKLRARLSGASHERSRQFTLPRGAELMRNALEACVSSAMRLRA